MKTIDRQQPTGWASYPLQQQQKGAKPPAPPPPIPPVTESSADVAQASAEAKRAAAKRQGYGSTLLAGETGGAKDDKKTLLG